MKIKTILQSCLLIMVYTTIQANSLDTLPEFKLEKATFKNHVYYLASDELMGRKTGTEGNNLAAKYIAETFSAYGLKQFEALENWYQPINFKETTAPAQGLLKFGDTSYLLNKKLILTSGQPIDTLVEAIFAGYGWQDEATGYDNYQDIDVQGKVVFVLPGNESSSHPFTAFELSAKKKKIAAKLGALALIELYRVNFPWHYFKDYQMSDKLEISYDDSLSQNLIHGWLKESDKSKIAALKRGEKIEVHLTSSGVFPERIVSNNVLGWVEGTDPVLKNEYLILTAHYDHVGTKKAVNGEQDTIFNGARDNAMGVAALLAAAKSLGEKPPKRSIIFAAVTAEEMGLLGSLFYADNPIIPLEQTIFNLNNDGGGYNSTEHFCVIGYGRTGIDAEVEMAAKAVGKKIYPNPMPDENLFDRSDNVSFARKGVPCIDFAPGALSFDEEVMKYYHQTADNPDQIDYNYLLKFCQSYAHLARLIADKQERPIWVKGDKYEEMGKSLYQP